LVGKLKRAFNLGPCAWKGAAYLLLATGATVWFGTFIGGSPGSVHGWLVNLSLAVLIGVLSILLGHLIVLLLELFQEMPKLYLWFLVGTVILLFNLLKPSILLIINVIGTLLFLVVASSLFGAGIGALTERRLEAVKRRLAVGMLLLAGFALWRRLPGFSGTARATGCLILPWKIRPFPVCTAWITLWKKGHVPY
jgi:hypothetical protein